MPLFAGVSASTPPRNAARNSTNGRRWSSFTSKRRPFGRSNFWTALSVELSTCASSLGVAPLGNSA